MSSAAEVLRLTPVASAPWQVSVTVRIMLDILQGQRGDAGSRYLALLALGEIGRTTDLSSYEGVSQAVTGALEGSSLEELRTAASSALGGLAVGSTSLASALPFILQQVQAQVMILALSLGCLVRQLFSGIRLSSRRLMFVGVTIRKRPTRI